MRVFNFDPLDLVRYHGQALLWDRAIRGALAVAGPSLSASRSAIPSSA